MVLRSAKATERLGVEFARARERGGVVALTGPLGSGKTTFVRGLARGLGITLPVQSPTYVLLQVFQTKHPTVSRLVHADLYRIERPEELPAELFEFMADPATLVVIEWAERLKSKLPVEPVWVTFNHRDEDSREVTIGRRSLRSSEQPSRA